MLKLETKYCYIILICNILVSMFEKYRLICYLWGSVQRQNV